MDQRLPIVRFGQFEFDLERDQLRRSGVLVRLSPQPARLLRLLLERAGDVVTREEIRDHLWPDGTYVDFEQGINHAIRRIRTVLRDDAASARFVETLPRVGYRFFGGIEVGAPAARAAVPPAAPPAPPVPSAGSATAAGGPTPWARHLRVGWGIGVLSVLVLALGVGVTRMASGPHVGASASFRDVQLDPLTESGDVRAAALSPDGNYIAYSRWETPDGFVVRLKTIERNSDIRVVEPHERPVTSLAFSPDGDTIYFTRPRSPGPGYSTLYRVAKLGGPVHEVLFDVDSGVGFSPDGRRMAFVRGFPQHGRGGLFTVRPDGSDERRVTVVEAPDVLLAQAPAWSADGARIAVAVRRPVVDSPIEVVAVDVATGAQTALGGARWDAVRGLDWLPDGSGLLLAAAAPGGEARRQVWTLDYPSGKVQRVSNDLTSYAGVSLSSSGRRLVSVTSERRAQLWSYEMRRDGASNRWNGPSPLGDLVKVRRGPAGGALLATRRDDRTVLWNVPGPDAAPRPVLHETAPSVRRFGVSPDGATIVYEAGDPEGVPHLWRVATAGGTPARLTDGAGETAPTVCGADGTVLFVRPGEVGIWRIDGPGDVPRRVVDLRPYSAGPVCSPDGSRVAFDALLPEDGLYERHLFVAPVDGGEPTPVLRWPVGRLLNWTPDGAGLTWVAPIEGTSNVWRVDLADATAGARPITGFGRGTIYSWDWSGDGEWLLCAQGSTRADAVLLTEVR